MKKIVLGLCFMLFSSGIFANNVDEKETIKKECELAYGCTTTIWYTHNGTHSVVSFYHDDCSGQACCNDYLRRDIDILKLHYAMEDTNQGQEIISLPVLEGDDNEGLIIVVEPGEQP
ncbi:hypothetical protein [Flavobacterium chilense]|uniref:Secreted protein n=1 Tax=Flavobacterium chilense TaxID=946677 RepID=A0A1M7DZH8_9FLAO|nr:hypothetical protein [Flavobacterium chilense]SHL84860.1 hypothetical protein SAMN05444484_102794 [Flavobacterium chilense]